MYRRLRDYTLALAVICLACLVYCLTVAQWIEPSRKQRAVGLETPIPDLPNPYEHLFQPGDWELNSPKILLTSQGTLLFLDYQPLENGRLEIRPCTLIVYSQDAETQQSGRPVVMRAAEGAELQFDEEVDLARGQFGRLVGGRILGDILIFSPPSGPDANDALELTTRNLQVERLKAWTTSAVRFRYGESFGSGHNLEITLSPAEQIAGKEKSSAVGSIEAVQLSQVDELMLQSPKRSILPATGDRRPANQPDESEPPVRITCDGPLKFDVSRSVATFDDRVLVQRLRPQGPSDQLRCEQLAVYLNSAATEKKEERSKPGTLGAGSVERIVAVGNPVVLEAPSQSAHTEAERLEYNLKTRQLLLKSFKEGAKVLLRRGSDEFRAPELAYEMVPGKRLGNLWAPGPGRLVSSTGGEEDKKPFAAQWQRELRIRPDKENQLVSLLGSAKIDAEGQGSFQADELHLWLLELPDNRTGSSRAFPSEQQNSLAAQSQGPGHPAAKQGAAGGLLPDRLLATGSVHADSSQLAADCQRLEAWFRHVPDSLPPAAVQPPDELSLEAADGSGRELREPVMRIHEPLPEKPAKLQHFHVEGNLIRLQVQQRGKQSLVETILIEGQKVRVTETNAADGEVPLSLAGTKIDLTGGIGAGCRIAVSGETNARGEIVQPAVLSARGIKLRSQRLNFSRRDNRVTMEQAGDMTLALEQDALGQKLESPAELSVSWQGSMLFDGSSARFRKGVVVRSDTLQAGAEELEVKLAAAVDFAQAKPGQKPEIKRLVMKGGAEFDQRTFDPVSGRLQAQQHLSAQWLDVDRISGAIQGAGPGWLSRVQLGRGLPASNSGNAAVAAPANSSDELNYLRVDFRRELTGNLHRRQIEFAEKVQAIFGPVSGWDEMIEPTSRESLGSGSLILTADRLAVADFLPPGAEKGATEMVATGNTRVEGRDFTALAHRLTYTGDKTQLVLEGDGRNDAEIKHRLRDSVAAQKLLYWHDTGNLQIEGGKSINIGPTTARPLPLRSPRDTR